MTHKPLASPATPPARKRARKHLRQSNADYRWTVPKVTAFLAALAQCGRVAEAARAVGMSRQAAYALRARLDGPAFLDAFAKARAKGLRAKAAASVRRSKWDGPGISALDHLRAGGLREGGADRPAAQTATPPVQADTAARQAYFRKRQAYARRAQADALAHKPAVLPRTV